MELSLLSGAGKGIFASVVRADYINSEISLDIDLIFSKVEGSKNAFFQIWGLRMWNGLKFDYFKI